MPTIDLSIYGILKIKKIIRNPSYDEIYDFETNERLEGFEKSYQTELGALNVLTGEFTGRSPKDKYIVMDDVTRDTIWWTSEKAKNDNKPITQDVWNDLKAIVQKQLSGKELFVVDTYCGANEDSRLKVKFITEVAWQAHFVANMFLRPTKEELENYAEMLSEKFKASSDDEAFEFSEAIRLAGVRLNRLIRNFIFYEKLQLMSTDSQSIALLKGVTEITPDLVINTSYKVADRFNRKDDMDISADKSVISVPVTYILILIEELLDNAFKFSNKGTKVTLSGNKKDEYYQLIITDKGRGMTEKQLASISAYLQFERYRYEQQGMGLGLTISMKIADIYGGTIKINSKYGEYTEVIVSLPLVKM